MKRSELIFTEQASEAFLSYCQSSRISKAIIVVDNHTQELCLPLLNIYFPSIVIPPGETYKNLHTLESVLDGLVTHQADKDTLVVNLGGGVVSDIGGFAASIFKRGMRYVNIPTTLLAMVDAAIGGKTGIDFHSYKNYLGTFHMPEAVIISTEFLKTLPQPELQSAWAEIIKSAVIGNKDLFQMIEKHATLSEVIAATSAFKQKICEMDFKDENIRQLLNFGHTIGHAYESYRLSIDHPVMHGMAVAKGMVYEARLAERLGLLSSKDASLICGLINSKMQVDELSEEEFGELKRFLSGDKKNSEGFIVFSLPVGIGQGTYGVKVGIGDLKI
jgi:3-dehydroquinate synthase